MNKISLCMIVKNEEKNLENCLSAIAGYMDEIIIVDTGSVDRTKEISYRYTEKVYDYEWKDDFAAARNFSLSKASNEYVLVIDSDEFTESIDIITIKQLINENPLKIGRLLRINEFTRKGTPYRYIERVNRLFNRNYFHYQGIIHEQVVPYRNTVQQFNKREHILDKESILEEYAKEASAPGSGADITAEAETYLLPLTVRHSGYEGDLDTRRKKTERNISLLKLAQEKAPEDPYLLYQLGKSYYMEEQYLKACDYFGQALYFDLDPRLEYVQDMVESYGYSLINSGQYVDALKLLNVYDEFSRSADFIFLIAIILMNNAKFLEAIDEFTKATERPEAKMEGVNGFLAYYNIGVIYECLDQKNMAIRFYRKCGDYEAARKRLLDLK